jgi:hypothetical protein
LVVEAELHLMVLEHKPQLLEVLVAVELGKKDHLLVLVGQVQLVKVLLVEATKAAVICKAVAVAAVLVVMVIAQTLLGV